MGLLLMTMKPAIRERQDAISVTDPGGGMRGTWQWTWLSLLTMIVVGYAPPSWALILTGVWQTREIILVVIGAVSLAANIVFVGALRSGLSQDATSRRTRLVLVVLATVPWAVASASPPLALEWMLIPWVAVSLIAVDLPRRRRWWWLGGAALCLVLIRVIVAAITGTAVTGMWAVSDTPVDVLVPLLVILLPMGTVFQVWLWQVVISLNAAKAEQAELARTQERLRFASDLHNIQGHHLQVIALKTELAERLIHRDPSAATTLIHETQELAREALEDTRRLVKGYRAVSFVVEAENAAAILNAAGIHVQIDITATPPAAVDHLLGSLLREATTNIIRHSTASHAHITLASDPESITLSISNNGVPDHRPGNDGTGILGLSEQYHAAGGILTTVIDSDLFTLRGTLPQTAGAP